MINDKVKIALIGTAVFMSGVTAFAWIKKPLGDKIISTAKKYIGQREIGKDAGFANPEFEKIMSRLGLWRSGNPWCASFARAVWLMALPEKYRSVAKMYLSPSTQATYANFANDRTGLFYVSQKPKTGSIVIWKSQKAPAYGHAGLYMGYQNGKHYFIEGNSSGQVKINAYADYTYKSSDLKLRGFIHWR